MIEKIILFSYVIISASQDKKTAIITKCERMDVDQVVLIFDILNFQGSKRYYAHINK